MIRILVCGGRDFSDYFRAERALEDLLSEINPKNDSVEIISGGASGADRCGEIFAEKHGLHIVRYSANWARFGKIAGIQRNLEMVDYLDRDDGRGIVVAFWDGKSRGTASTIRFAKERGLEVRIFGY